MASFYITADDVNGFSIDGDDNDVFVKSGVLLGASNVAPRVALELTGSGNTVTVQGAVVGDTGVGLGPIPFPGAGNCTLSIAEGGLVAGNSAVSISGSGSTVTNQGDIMGVGSGSDGLTLFGSNGASTIDNFGSISGSEAAIYVRGGDDPSQTVTLRNSGEISSPGFAYNGGNSSDIIDNKGVMDGSIALGSGDDAYKGGQGALRDAINGGGGADRIICGSEDNKINGGLGSDVLKGGGGADQFFFKHELGSGNIDKIRDFRAVDDRIRLEDEIFTEIDGSGRLSGEQFVANASGSATDADHRIVHETDTGRLIYDSNGSAAGGATLIGVLSGTPVISAADFFVS